MNSSDVLDIFRDITRIPRESGHEGPMTAFLVDFAKKHGLQYKVDDVQNVCIIKEAAPGKEDVPTIVLQSHQDMVCEKTSTSTHDFLHDPIEYVIEDGWMIAKETTLGADDGIGIAASLALLESDIPMGKIECVFTISEETGMDGAEGMKEGFFTGKTLINLDSEDDGQLFIGCAGGVNTTINFKYCKEKVSPAYKVLKIQLGGAVGGHSGDDINKERMNVVQQLSRFLYDELPFGLQLIDFEAGGKPNAIARDGFAVIAVPDAKATKERFEAFFRTVSDEYHTTEKSLFFDISDSCGYESAVDSKTAGKLIFSMFTCPHGVIAMSQDIPGLVETSTNLASVHFVEGEKIKVVTSQRSSTDSEKKMIADKVEANFVLAGAEVEHLLPYPGWKPDVNSHILKACIESYRKLFNAEPEVKAIHAGLECGLFLEKFHNLDMISFGPTLRSVHAPGERLELSTVDKFVDLLVDVVTNFKG